MKKYLFVTMFAAVAVLAQDAPANGVKPAETAKPAAPAAGAKAKPPVKLLPPRVRTGSIVKAEFTTQKPEAEGQSPVSQKSSPAWAVLTLKLDPGRAASVFDYVLSKDGTEYRVFFFAFSASENECEVDDIFVIVLDIGQNQGHR